MTNTSSFDTEGLIKAATVSAPDAARLAETYSEYFGWSVVEENTVPDDMAAGWGAPGMAGQPYFVMGSSSATPVYVRIVENPDMPAYTPLRTYGWNAMEICVEDVYALYAKLEASPFEVIGPPVELEISNIFIPMQAIGPANEVLFLNEVRGNMPNEDLPKAAAPVDHIFIMVLATPDREKAIEFYTTTFGWREGDSYNLTYTVINNAFGLGTDHKTDITTTGVGRLVNNEIDQYPNGTIERKKAEGMLPPGIAVVSYMVQSLDEINVEFITPPRHQSGAMYDGRRTASCIGAAGELIELIEIG